MVQKALRLATIWINWGNFEAKNCLAKVGRVLHPVSPVTSPALVLRLIYVVLIHLACWHVVRSCNLDMKRRICLRFLGVWSLLNFTKCWLTATMEVLLGRLCGWCLELVAI